ncbi:MAG: exodeoxyribonuclease alpha subunit [Frankiaceae bacterium]|jgi:exodeoxyribonuclease V alpha subunit|nr:exodeoxyribonuclease alpha subunit [Frankiaceae bacterium]
MTTGADSPVQTPLEALCQAGLWTGVTAATARKLAAGGVTDPGRITRTTLESLTGMAAKKLDDILTAAAKASDAYAVVRLLAAAGLPARLAAAAIETLGRGAAGFLQTDPWRIVELGPVSAEQADAFASATLGQSLRELRGDPRRGGGMATYLLIRAARDGHTAQPLSVLADGLASLDVADVAGALDRAAADDRLVVFEDEDLASLTRYAAAEEAVADGIGRLLAAADRLGTPAHVEAVTGGLDDAQAAAVAAMAESGVVVLTGGPGTGKSRTVAAVVALADKMGLDVALAAPTGRAAKRLEELTDAPASTLHRLLGAQGRTGQFARGETWPLEHDIVVVDEASMLDVELAAALLEACDDGTHVLFVGDAAQLPSIGAGRVLGDLIASGAVPVIELTTLHRQAEGGTIARLAAEIRVGVLPPVDDPTHEVVVVRCPKGSTEAAHRAVQLVTDSIPRVFGLSPEDIQVVTPVHRGPAGTAALNAVLKARLNPGSGTVGGFDVGDRVVATANHLDDGWANGDVGTVLSAGHGTVVVAFSGGDPVPISGKSLGDLMHGWAITVHRAQGSEWPAVVAVLPPEAGGLLTRPLVYTAFTRAARHLSVVHAAGAALGRAVQARDVRPRRTRLIALLGGDTADSAGHSTGQASV